MPKIRKQLAIAFARNYAAGLVENSECGFLEGIGLTDDELAVAQEEMSRIANRIDATVNVKVLAQLGTTKEIEAQEIKRMLKSI